MPSAPESTTDAARSALDVATEKFRQAQDRVAAARAVHQAAEAAVAEAADVEAAVAKASAARIAVEDAARIANVYASRKEAAAEALRTAELANLAAKEAAAVPAVEEAACALALAVKEAGDTMAAAWSAFTAAAQEHEQLAEQLTAAGGKPTRLDRDSIALAAATSRQLVPASRGPAKLDVMGSTAAFEKWLLDAPKREAEAKARADHRARELADQQLQADLRGERGPVAQRAAEVKQAQAIGAFYRGQESSERIVARLADQQSLAELRAARPRRFELELSPDDKAVLDRSGVAALSQVRVEE